MAQGPSGYYSRAVSEHQQDLDPGGAIRTISVSLLAVAAVITGVLLNRTRQPTTTSHKADEIERPAVSLEELRRAGF